MAEAAGLTRWRFAAGCALLGVLGFFPFVRGTRVPLLGWIDLALHEFGHVAALPLPDVATAMMGNGFQTGVPLALAGVFVLRERDWLGTVLCVGWAAATLQDASLYIGDAPYQRLQLIGGTHDWAFALRELGLLDTAGMLARVVWSAGLVLWLVAVAGAAAGAWIEPALKDGGVRAAVAAVVRRPGVDRSAASPHEGPAAQMPADAWSDFYGKTPDRAKAKRTSLS